MTNGRIDHVHVLHTLHEVGIEQPWPIYDVLCPSLHFVIHVFLNKVFMEPKAAPRCLFPWVVMCTSVPANISFAEDSCFSFTTKYVLEVFG